MTKPIYEEHILEALHAKFSREPSIHKTNLIVQELGIEHSKSVIDLAVINDKIHGFEIKSAQDNLCRLDRQLDTYSRNLENLTFVAASKHIGRLEEKLPLWCGIYEVTDGNSDTLKFRIIRKSKLNPEVQVYFVAHLLWKHEAIKILSELNMPYKIGNLNRKALYRIISNELSLQELTCFIKRFMLNRKDWKYHDLHK